MNLVKKIAYLLLAIIFFYNSGAVAKTDQLQQRLLLINASQNLARQEEKITEKKLGIFVTEFGSKQGEASIGGSLEVALFDQQILRMLNEIIYLKSKESLAGFISLKLVYPVEKNLDFYLGSGIEVAGEAQYQIFTGFNILEDFFIEAKYINSGAMITSNNLCLTTGIQLGF